MLGFVRAGELHPESLVAIAFGRGPPRVVDTAFEEQHFDDRRNQMLHVRCRAGFLRADERPLQRHERVETPTLTIAGRIGLSDETAIRVERGPCVGQLGADVLGVTSRVVIVGGTREDSERGS